MSMKTSSCWKKGFTLIELLVVITIIALLAGIAFPAIGKALQTAKKAEASAMINNLKIALTSYNTEYGSWPDNVFTDETSSVESGNKDLYEMLAGISTTNNPRKISFMDFNAKVLRTGELSPDNTRLDGTAEGFVDPWNQPYRLLADVNYDNEIELPIEFTDQQKLNTSLIIWSRGNQSPWDDVENQDKNYIRSWK